MSIAAETTLQSILSRLVPPVPGTDQFEDVQVGVNDDNGSVALYPIQEGSSLASLLLASNRRAAIKAHTPAIRALLADADANAVALAVDHEIELPIVESLASASQMASSRPAAVVRRERALVVWADDVDNIPQFFLDLEHQLRHSARLCNCAQLPTVSPRGSLNHSNLHMSLDDEFLFGSDEDFPSGAAEYVYDGERLVIPQLELSFNPLSMASGEVDEDPMDSGVAQPRVQVCYYTTCSRTRQ
ncbi:uncharacterized protein C8Q71DRAFT_278654 [Rhodofomes roseus]|uniref:DUF7928 domain-containing protein n=1 Tax=Rhodofomes roseus TaxID=34475 RepID=A0ABQ8K539_9APHY|nr:uncharacterized protein C8Q71DRAFT_278654 [Rhodofomes roseus]KAH9832036.1 hypothetical protein C8Q71DRAFT_278654 [Rhodofomes roseus]